MHYAFNSCCLIILTGEKTIGQSFSILLQPSNLSSLQLSVINTENATASSVDCRARFHVSFHGNAFVGMLYI